MARDRMTARGPDDAGLWVKRWSDPPSEAHDPRPTWVGLAHRRLAIRLRPDDGNSRSPRSVRP